MWHGACQRVVNPRHVPKCGANSLRFSAPQPPCIPIAMPLATPPPRMSQEEKRIARDMAFTQGMTPADVARRLHRSLSTITRLFAQRHPPKPIGRPPALTEGQVDRLENILNEMVDKADGQYEVTVAMVTKRARLKVSERVVSDALHARGIYFRKLRSKPILELEHIKDRYSWAQTYRHKPAKWWLQHVHVHLDNHAFKVATTHLGRRLLSRRRVRGVYRTKKKSLRRSVVKPNAKLRQNTGARGVLVAGGVGAGRTLVWHVVDTAWGGDAAALFYKNAVRPALKQAYPGKTKFVLLEDNDPSGNTSGKGKAAKAAMHMTVLSIPKYSPDLNVMDYAVWAEVEKRMRKQERSWPSDRKETRDMFIKRLARVAKSLPSAFIEKSIMDLKRRCELLYQAKGGLFEEGGRPRKAKRSV
jgi:transposase